jgi:ketosteroid isomerase-like protein
VTSDAATLEVLAARAEIADLVHRYARIIRTGDIEECPALFTPDATFEVREMTPGDPSSAVTRAKLEGREAILEYVRKSAAGATVCPLIHNLLIDVEGNSATSNAVMTAHVWSSGQTLIGEYRDRFCKDDAWRFTARIYTILRPQRA